MSKSCCVVSKESESSGVLGDGEREFVVGDDTDIANTGKVKVGGRGTATCDRSLQGDNVNRSKCTKLHKPSSSRV